MKRIIRGFYTLLFYICGMRKLWIFKQAHTDKMKRRVEKSRIENVVKISLFSLSSYKLRFWICTNTVANTSIFTLRYARLNWKEKWRDHIKDEKCVFINNFFFLSSYFESYSSEWDWFFYATKLIFLFKNFFYHRMIRALGQQYLQLQLVFICLAFHFMDILQVENFNLGLNQFKKNNKHGIQWKMLLDQYKKLHL